MKHRMILIAVLTLLAVSIYIETVHTPSSSVNPDPNHTHADFAVWIDGTQLDFSGPEFMSGSSDEKDPNHTKHDKYLHLHDGNGHVIHRHKQDRNLGEFFTSLGLDMDNGCTPNIGSGCIRKTFPLRLFVNGDLFITDTETPYDRLYVFEDLDQILLTDATDPIEVQKELKLMTDDACLYSKTCPERGAPPIENCIADLMVPCTQ